MSDERRIATLENVLVAIGELKSLTKSNNDWLKDLNDKVKVQNGRVGELEKWKAYLFGINTVIVIFLVPIAIKVITDWILGKI